MTSVMSFSPSLINQHVSSDALDDFTSLKRRGTGSPPPIKHKRIDDEEEEEELLVTRTTGTPNRRGHRVSFKPSEELLEIREFTFQPAEWNPVPHPPIPSDELDEEELEVSQWRVPTTVPVLLNSITRQISNIGLFSFVSNHIASSKPLKYTSDSTSVPPDNPTDLTEVVNSLLSFLPNDLVSGISSTSVPPPVHHVPLPPPISYQQPSIIPPIHANVHHQPVAYKPHVLTDSPLGDGHYPRELFPPHLIYDVRGPDVVAAMLSKSKNNALKPCHFFSNTKKNCKAGSRCSYVHDPALKPPFPEFLYPRNT
ncbi:hypothetical protein RCL1_007248 [Eukaryota sp. TZLM3-RCL]